MSRLIDLESHDDTTQPVDLRHDPIDVGEPVEVRRRFDNAWARGFIVAGLDADGYRLRRNSDGALLPVGFPRTDLRRSAV